jgi:hypothetical protein
MPTEIFCCPDCNEFCATSINSLCPDCERWREQKLAEMDEDYQRQQARRARMKMSPGARFGEELADMAKAVERSRR